MLTTTVKQQLTSQLLFQLTGSSSPPQQSQSSYKNLRMTVPLLLLNVTFKLIVINLISFYSVLPLASSSPSFPSSSASLGLISPSSSSSSSSSDTFYFELPENTPAGQLVGTIPIKSGFTYRFNVDYSEFRFNQSTGSILTTSTPTDRESRDYYHLVLLSSSPTYPIEIRIKITDVNDNPPYWPPYINRNLSFSESAPIGTKLILETAIDQDEGSLTYQIVPTTISTTMTTTMAGSSIDSSVNSSSHSLSSSETKSLSQSINDLPFKLSYNVSSSFLHLEVSDSLDRETQSNYIVNISAVDEGGLSAYLTLYVTILDVNDNPPIFDHSDYTVSLNETIGKGVPILQVRATDADEEGNDNTAISYYLLSDNYFTIDPETGVIYTASEGPIDCGTTPISSSSSQSSSSLPSSNSQSNYGSISLSPLSVSPPTNSVGYKVCVFTVFAHDHGTPRQNGRAYITVNLLDTNDHDPVIKFRHVSRSEVASVDENAVNGSVVTAVSVSDGDHGPNGETTLTIVSGNEVGHFRLESIGTSHIVRVNGLLDREAISSYNLTLVARDYGTPSRSSTANLIIMVNDVNDHEPVFNRDLYEVNLVESLPIGSFVVSLSAVDLDEGINAKLYYSLSGPNAHFFKIDTLTGLVTTEKIINREINPVFELKATARDGGPNPKWAYSTLKIAILDVNDEIPQLILPKDNHHLSYENASRSWIYEIEESTKLSLPLISYDTDLGANGTVDCGLLHKYGGLFQIIDSSKETGQQGNQQNQQQQSYQQHHRLISTAELDYEKCPEYKLSLVVKDRGLPGYQLSSTVMLTIKVKDKDDHRPIVYPSTYFAFIPVNFSTLNYSIVVSRVLIRDPDILTPVTFTLDSGYQNGLISSILSLNSRTGEINLKTGSRFGLGQSTSSPPSLLKFNVTCQGCEPIRSRATFNVYTLSEESRKSVENLRRSYEFEISESADIGTIIGKIELHDSARSFDCLIISGDPSNVFTVDRHYLKVAGKLDRETQSTYKLQLVAYNERAFFHIDVKVSLIDVNDNQPLFFEQFIELTLPVDVPPKLTIYRLNAIDADHSNGQQRPTTANPSSSPSLDIRYDLISNPDHLLFIEGNELKVNRSLSSLYPPGQRIRSQNNVLDVITFEVMATDPGSTQQTSPLVETDSFNFASCGLTNRLTIHLMVKSVNSARPRFSSNLYETSLSESIPVNSQFLNIAASDDDGDLIAYKITSGNHGGAFGIFPDGQLYVQSSLDRESIETYSLKIIAYEELSSSNNIDSTSSSKISNESLLLSYFEARSTTQVIIHVIDENDNPPLFTNRTFYFRLEENCQENTPIGQVTAWDKDKGANSEIHYSLSESNVSNLIEIDPYSGHLWSKVTFDAESIPRLTLEVLAIDQSFETKRLTSSATVIIEIVDVNDNPPLFTSQVANSEVLSGESRSSLYPVETFSLSEDTPVGTIAATITAIDADKSSIVTYKLLDSTVQSTSKVDLGEIYEDSVLTKPSGSGNGSGGNNENGGESYFHLNSSTGAITLSRFIDREVTSLVQLLVSADDGHHYSYKLIRFVILDVNDNPPKFINFTTTTLTLPEDVKVGSVILTWTAIDPDLSDLGSPIRYQLTVTSSTSLLTSSSLPIGATNDQRKRKLFDIQGSSLIVASPLDFEIEKSHYLNISAIDGVGHRSEVKMVTIIVTDVNDCSPTFNINPVSPSPSQSSASSSTSSLSSLQQSDVVRVSENIEIGSKLVSLAAYDCDSGDTLTYEIVACETRKDELSVVGAANNNNIGELGKRNFFASGSRYYRRTEQLESTACPVTINPTNGDLVSSNALDREIAETISVSIRVRDSAGHFAIKQVTILLEDINDNYPEFISPDLFLVISAHHHRIEENQVIGIVKAVDVDAGINSVVTYKLASTESPDQPLSIDPRSGEIRSRRPLEGYINRPISILAIDGAGLVTSDTVTFIHLSPSIYSKAHEKSDLSLDVYENEPVGLRLHKFKCPSDRLEKCEFFVRRASDRTIAVDRHSGDLYIQSNLDREAVDSYSIEVVSIQGSEVYVTLVKIRVLDKDDNPPIIRSLGSSLLISEATPVGSELFDLSTITSDPDSSSKIEYKLINCSGCLEPTFRVDTFSGKIILQKPLDRETINGYKLIVGASDSFHLTIKEIGITVTDVNDNAPHFKSKQYYFDIPENMDRGLVVGTIEAFDLDSAPNSLTYAMVNDGSLGGPEPEESIFSLNEKTGKFTLMRHLDYESDPNHFIVTCEAFDGLYRSEQINVYFNLINVNDNWPVFDPATYKIELAENVTLGSQVACLSATDADSYDANDNGLETTNNESTIKYYFKESSQFEPMVDLGRHVSSLITNGISSKLVSGPFQINKSSGCIELIRPLDRESIASYDLTVLADDGFHVTSASVHIKVKDVNDNEPIFDRRTPSILRVPENLGPDSLVYGFKADDADDVPNNYIQYDLENGNPGSNDFPFTIGPIDGLLRLTGRLDRESIDTYRLIVRARDYGGRSSSVSVTLSVTDVNDNSPTFDQTELHVSISENTSIETPVLTFRASDLDSPDKISYRIVSGDLYGHFSINEDSLIVAMPLDYETLPNYDLRIQAIDEAGNSDTARVIVNLINVHDEPPTFLGSPYTVNWCENEIGDLGTFEAIGEITSNGQRNGNRLGLNYLLKNNHEGYFELNSSSAALSVIKPIDRESLNNGNGNSLIELRIIAIDKRYPRLTGEGVILINIIDVNDNKPAFKATAYSFELIENSIHFAGKPFGRVEATDLDSSDRLTYEIIADDSDGIFIIDQRTGDLSLRSDTSFDREQRLSYSLTIACYDSKWTALAQVTINIGDVNDCKPVFRSINEQSLDSSSNHVTLQMDLARLSAIPDDLFLFGLFVTDCDLADSPNSRVQFNLETGSNDGQLFTIDERVGIVRSTKPLEANSTYNLKILAEDMPLKNRLYNSLSVELKVTSINNNQRQVKRLIELVHKISVNESVKVGKIVHSFGVLPEVTQTSTSTDVSLKIIGGDPSGRFRVDGKYLRIAQSLDYEETSFYDLYIEANFNLAYEITRVQIEVSNENDNPPKFDFDFYNASIVEEIEEPVLVTSLSASDRDLNLSSYDEDGDENPGSPKLRYSIESPKDAPFRIDEKYGTLWTTGRIDRETNSSFNLIVAARDEDNFTGTTRVIITVLDKNDNPPRFTRLFSVNITENAPIGSTVIQVTSSDRDEGPYAQASYSLLSHSDAFDIHPTSGEVFVTGHLDRESRDEYLLMVSANDGSWKAQTTLTINIIDENDNLPIFDRSLYEFRYTVSEGDEKSSDISNEIIGQVRAKDPDKGLNSLISYSLKHSSDYFTIDRMSGVIRLKPYGESYQDQGQRSQGKSGRKRLTYNSSLQFLNQYNLTVIASDRGVIPQSSETTVIITLIPSRPESQATLWSPSITHKLALPYDLLNGTVLYQLEGDFSLKRESLGLTKIVTFSTTTSNSNGERSSQIIFIGQGVVKRNEEYSLTFESPRRSVTLILSVCSPNRASPRFTSGQSQLVVPENESANDVLTQFKATDDDEDAANSQVTYSFEIIEWIFNERATDYYQKVIRPSLELTEPLLIGLSLRTLLNQTVSTKSILKPFTLDPTTGIVYLNAPLDYELITCYRIRVTAADSATFNQLNTSILVNIHVTDVNDNPPIFQSTQSDGRIVLETLENNPIGTTIGTLRTIDYDSLRYSQITYEILPELDSGLFTVSPKSGQISALISFDYESKRHYSLRVSARNDRKVASTALVEIRVGNVNEYLPKFKSSRFTFDLTKAMLTPGYVIGNLADSATDEDYNETIYFYLIKHRPFGVDLDRNGTLRVTDHVDANSDNIPPQGVTFTVIAKNSGPIHDRNDYDEAKIVLHLAGINRLSHFNQSNYICNGDKNICPDDSTSPDALSVGTILFVIFFAIIMLILLASFIIFHQQRKRPMPSCIGGTIGQRKLGLRQIPKSHPNHTLNGSHSQSSSFLHPPHHNQPTAPPPPPPPLTKQRPPDVIESPVSVPPAPPIPQRAPPVPPPSFMTPFNNLVEDYSDVMVTGEQYDLENASSIAPSDIDLVYRYKGFRSAGSCGLNGLNSLNDSRMNSGSGHHHLSSSLHHHHNQHHHRHAPLARLSPSVSELTAPRILTLNDLTSSNGPSSVVMGPPPCSARPPPPPVKNKLGSTALSPAQRRPFNPMETRNSTNQSHHHDDIDEDDESTDDSFSSSEFDAGSSNYERAENNKNIMLRRVL